MPRGRDHRGLTDQSEDVDTTLSEDVKAAARRVVAANAVDYKGNSRVTGRNHPQLVDDAEQIMLALGIHPSQEKSWVPSVGPSTVITMPSRSYAGPQ